MVRLVVARLLTRALPAHGFALGALALVLAFSPTVADSYGVAADSRAQRTMAGLTVDYLRGESDQLLRERDLRYFAPAFELALLAVERTLGLTETRDIWLSRYFSSHFFFLACAFAFYLLANRMFGSRVLALVAMLLYVLHPRLYGHSFFNTKDLPFLGMFVVALLLAHWAFQKRGVWAFALFGAWSGLAAVARPMAFSLIALVLAALCVDFLCASRQDRKSLLPRALRGAFEFAPQTPRQPQDLTRSCGSAPLKRLERWRVLAAAFALAGAAAAVVFAGLPFLWTDPVGNLVEWLGFHSDHYFGKGWLKTAFMGEMVASNDRPISYIPVWVSVTTPPLLLLLALLGAVALCVKVWANPRAALANTPLRFEVLLAASALVPTVVVTFWVGTLYDCWRHMYFLHAPLCLFACAGLRWLLAHAGRRLAVLAHGVVGLGIGGVVASLFALHPHQHVYFNFLVDRATPERLATLFYFEYRPVSRKAPLAALLQATPEGPVALALEWRNRDTPMFPEEQRRRLIRSSDFSAVWHGDRWEWLEAMRGTDVRPLHHKVVFGSTLYVLYRLRMEGGAAAPARRRYHDVASMTPVARNRFDVHWDGGTITYLRRACRPEDLAPAVAPDSRPAKHGQYGRFFLHVLGTRKDAGQARAVQVHNEDFSFRFRGVAFADDEAGGVCIAHQDLRGYRVGAIRTGQIGADDRRLWSVAFAGDGAPLSARRAREAFAAATPAD